MTDEEITALDLCDLPRDTPYVIQGVSQTQFSIARYYGSVRFNGYSYVYVPPTDELIRMDVVKWLATRRRQIAKATREINKAKQKELL